MNKREAKARVYCEAADLLEEDVWTVGYLEDLKDENGVPLGGECGGLTANGQRMKAAFETLIAWLRKKGE